MTRSRLVSLLLAVLIVSSVVVPAPAAAGHVETCGEVDEFFWLLSVGIVNSDKCDPSRLSEALNDMEEDTADKTELNIYDAASTQRQQRNSFTTTMGNYLQDTRTVAWGKGEAAAHDAIANDSSRLSTKRAANDSVESYYTQKQLNLISSWNVTVSEIHKLHEIQANDTNIDGSISGTDDADYVYAANSTGPETNQFNNLSIEIVTVSLANGSTRDTKALNWSAVDGQPLVINKQRPLWNEYDQIMVDTPDGDTTLSPLSYIVTTENKFADRWSSVNTQKNYVKDNIGVYVDGIYDASQKAGYNSSDVISPTTQAQEYTTDWNETGHWSYAVAALASAGFSTPDLNGTGTMTVEYESNNYTALLMSRTAPNGTWESDKEYDPTTIDGQQFLITTGGGKIEMASNFTIHEMTNQNGTVINSTETQKYYYQGVNESDYNDIQQQLSILRTEIEERNTGSAGGGSSSGVDWSSPEVMALAAAVAIILLGRSR